MQSAGGEARDADRKPEVLKRTRRPAHAVPFPIAGVGASAGGLEALQEFFHAMPSDAGITFVVITHQHPGHASLLPELLARQTKLPVVEAVDGLQVEPNHVYVSPPGTQLDILAGKLVCMDARERDLRHLPVDHFFASLAAERKERAIGIILSGTGTDGTMGVKAIKGASGMVMVQQVKTAKYAGMPGSALSTGLVDYELPPSEMPAQLLAYIRGPYLSMPPMASAALPEMQGEVLQKVLVLMRSRTGHDFSNYKINTIRRRLERRMNLHQFEDPNHYVRYLQENPQEIDLLFKELLISVTSFFRDPEAFESLAKTALPELLKSRPANHVFRVWVPGCATGEEVYSLAILLRECQVAMKISFDVQIFGTDLDGEAIEAARAGHYPEGIANDVAPERLERFFTREDSGYRVSKDIREMAIFAVQNVIKDPPFTRLDLISCRNLLIYLNADLQKKLLPLFHYALRPGGLLFLGPSETVGSALDLFETAEKKWKIFRRKEPSEPARTSVEFPMSAAKDRSEASSQPLIRSAARESQHLGAAVERLLLNIYAPASVVVNERGDVQFIHGRTGQFLEPPSGQPQLNLHQMAREGLQLELASAMREASLKKAEVTRENVRVRSNGGFTNVDLSVRLLEEPEILRGMYLVAFRPSPSAAPPVKPGAPPSSAREAVRVDRLERELRHTKESLQTTIEELETSNEELKSTNEELQSTNEELQSTNEELETSKEEMQSLNEEMTTVNAELNAKVDELSRANDDMQNLLNSTDVATIFLDRELKISRYTERARHLVNLIQTDIGRPLGDLVSNLRYDHLEADCREVLRSLVFRESEVQTKDGRWLLMRVMPYRTAENVIDGLVLTFVDINPVKKAESQLAAVKERLAADLEAMTHLHSIGALFVRRADKQEVIEEILDAAIDITNASFGHVMLVDPASHRLMIQAHHGFRKDWMDFWKSADGFLGACGAAAKKRERVVVEDITSSPVFVGKPALASHLKAGVRAVQSTPILGTDGRLLGVVSTHFKKQHRPDQRALKLLDMLARLAGEVLERIDSETGNPANS